MAFLLHSLPSIPNPEEALVNTRTETIPRPQQSLEPWAVFDELVEGRRAIRKFASRPVLEGDMNDVIDAALLAPTSSNLQPFELVWVRSEDARHELVRACLSQSAARTAAELVVCVARWDRCDETRRQLAALTEQRPGARRMERFYYDRLARWVYDLGPLGLYGRARQALLAPAHLVLPLPRGPVTRSDVRTWAIKSAALVCENFMLAARAKGLDTCPMGGLDPVRVGRIAGLSPHDWKRTWDVTMVLAVGYRDERSVVTPRWRRKRSALVREI